MTEAQAQPEGVGGRVTWATYRSARRTKDDRSGDPSSHLGYRIDHLAAVMFAMVTFIATLIHIFALGYMERRDARRRSKTIRCTSRRPPARRGRYSRFFMCFSLFCFSMLNLVLADNLFQVFVSWELVGACSFGLIGFYYERQSATNAANKAFITNRVGDVGFIVGLMIVWTYVGTFNFQEIFARVRCAGNRRARRKAAEPDRPGRIVRVSAGDRQAGRQSVDPGQWPADVLYPLKPPATCIAEPNLGRADRRRSGRRGRPDSASMPYWLLIVAGLGHLPRLRRQVGAVPAAGLAAGRDGRADARLGAGALGDDGRGRRLSRRPRASRCSRPKRG